MAGCHISSESLLKGQRLQASVTLGSSHSNKATFKGYIPIYRAHRSESTQMNARDNES